MKLVNDIHIVALAGGVGGAKFVAGLAKYCAPHSLTIIVNTADDFEHLGLYISPDVDTVCYTLGNIENPVTGWGIAHDSYSVLDGIRHLGGPDWFRLGDKDISTHLERTRRLQKGEKLHEITKEFCRAWGIEIPILPMSNDPVRTTILTKDNRTLQFQEYFVLYRCEPVIKKISFKGVEKAEPAPGVIDALERADLVIICPSNPWVSIDPILSLSKVRSLIRNKPAVSISPIIHGKTIKGPASKMFIEMGKEASAISVAEHYQGIITDFILDAMDADLFDKVCRLEIRPHVTNTIMRNQREREKLALNVLNYMQIL